MDTTNIVDVVSEFVSLKKRGVRVGCCGLSSETRRTMERSGILALIGEENVYWSIDRALTQDCLCEDTIA